MKVWLKKIGMVLLAAALAVIPLTSCYVYYELELYSKPTMTEYSFDEETGVYTILVEGLLQNPSDIDNLQCEVTVLLLDEFGDTIESDSTYLSLGVGEIWHYYLLLTTEIYPTDFTVYARGY